MAEIEVQVLGLGVDNPESRPVLLLQETDGARRVLPVWIGRPEADALELATHGIVATRPGTHQLIAQLILPFEQRLQRVSITELRDNIFYAELVFDDDTRISARPSDAVVIAAHLNAPIDVTDAVLDTAAVEQTSITDDSTPPGDTPFDPSASATDAQERELSQFRRFLDTATPDDFDPN